MFSAAMLSETLFRIPRSEGLELLQKRGEHGARELTSWRLRVSPGRSARYRAGAEETVLVLQQGRGTLTIGDKQWPVSRSGVFTERATALYLPPGLEVTVQANEPLEAVLISTPAEPGGSPALTGPDEVVVNTRGRGNYTREVHDIFVRDPHVRRLMVGETFNPPGNWSSYPPHKHDGRDGEPELEEIYHFRIDPPQGFGHQVLYTNDGEAVTHQVRDGDAVLLPYGYHPVSAAPGYRLCYLWAMAGAERKLALFEDPAHRWIHEAPVA
jgi:5-deoxy-glucuronate isomerase